MMHVFFLHSRLRNWTPWNMLSRY